MVSKRPPDVRYRDRVSQRLRSAMLRAQLDTAGLAAAVSVDVKTVNRWLGGRMPHQRTRLAVAAVLGESEEDLWPQARSDLGPGAVATAEVVGAYAHRADIPQELWVSLLAGATTYIDIVGYAYPFILEMMPDAVTRLVAKSQAGAAIRLAFADPDCPHVMERDALEQMGGTLPGRIRNALNFLGPLHGIGGCEIGLHSVHLYNAVFRFDNQMIVTPYLFRARGYQHPALHLRGLSPHGIFASFADQFEQIWQTVIPLSGPGDAMSTRRDYYRDPNAPKANTLVPGGSAIVTDQQGRILMQRRTDSGNWALPGGVMDIGETLQQCVVREIKEETGLDIEITGLLGIYTDPQHVIAYADGEVRQEFNVTYHAQVIGGAITVSPESTEVRFINPAELVDLPVHDTVRLRLQHQGEQRQQPYLG